MNIKGKTRIEIYGEEKAMELKNTFSKQFSGKGNHNYQGGKIVIKCENCNKEFKVCKALKDVRKNCSHECYTLYCSMKCYRTTLCQEGNPNWKDGISFEPYSTDWTKELKLYIRTRDNFTCQLCNILEKEHLLKYDRVLSVHHIDYNKQNCHESNLITTCTKCNSKVNGNRDYWFAYFTYILNDRLELV